MVTVINLNAQRGDRESTLDTSTKAARSQLGETIEQKKRDGAAIFVHYKGDDYRVDRYDPQTDELVVHAKGPAEKGKPNRLRIKAARARLTVVAPTAGG